MILVYLLALVLYTIIAIPYYLTWAFIRAVEILWDMVIECHTP